MAKNLKNLVRVKWPYRYPIARPIISELAALVANEINSDCPAESMPLHLFNSGAELVGSKYVEGIPSLETEDIWILSLKLEDGKTYELSLRPINWRKVN
jgi:hypothetical protein